MAQILKHAFLLCVTVLIHAKYFLAEDCNKTIALGLSIGYVQNSQMTSSSSNGNNQAPYLARLDGASGWQSLSKNDRSWINEWIQIDFIHNVKLTGVASQPLNHLEGSDDNAITLFYLQVSNTSDEMSFRVLEDHQGETQTCLNEANFGSIIYCWLKRPTATRFVRLKAGYVKKSSSASSVAVRLEFYGCGYNAGIATCESLYPLGMHNNIIADSQLSGIQGLSLATLLPSARLNARWIFGWCPNYKSDKKWLRIDLGFPAVLTAIAMQGELRGDTVGSYYVRISNGTTFKNVTHTNGALKIFQGYIHPTAATPVLTVMNPTLKARIVEIVPREKGPTSKSLCAKVELFGYHQAGYDEILPFDAATFREGASDLQYMNISTPPLVSELTVHCMNESWFNRVTNGSNIPRSRHYLEVKLSQPRLITGVGIQGDPFGAHWISKFKLAYQFVNGSWIEDPKEYIGPQDRMDIGRHWFPVPKMLLSLRFHDMTPYERPCFRLQLYGRLDISTKYDVMEGKSVSLYCPNKVCPKKKVTWLDSNGKIIGESQSLSISEVNISHAGYYRCNTTGLDGHIVSPPIQLNVLHFRKPVLNVSSQLVVKEGNDLFVICKVKSSPISQVIWIDKSNNTIADNALLHLSSIKRNGSSFFTCVATNTMIGTANVSFGIQIQYLDAPMLSDENINLREFSSVNISCSANGKPKPSIKWSGYNKTTVKIVNNVIHLQNMTRESSGQFVCTANNSARVTKSAVSVKVIYLDVPVISDKNITVQEFNSVNISCSANGIPKPSIEWSGYNKTAVKIVNGVIHLQNVTRQLSGQLVCAANNSAGATKSAVNVKVTYLYPVKLNVSSNVTVEEGESLIVDCISDAFPKGIVTWKTSSNAVVSTERYLTFSNVNRSMAGLYQCTRENDYHQASNSFQLKVAYTNCSFRECQHGGKCVQKEQYQKCLCSEGHYGRYCDKVASGITLRLFFDVFDPNTTAVLRKQDVLQLIGTSASPTYLTFLGDMTSEVTKVVKKTTIFRDFFIGVSLKSIRISSVDLLYSVYFQEKFNASVEDVSKSVKETFQNVNNTLSMQNFSTHQYRLDITKLTVQDYDECFYGTHQCRADQYCVNTYYSYTCACPQGTLKKDKTCIPQKESDGLATFLIKGISICLSVIALVVLLIIFIQCKKRQSRKVQSIEKPQDDFQDESQKKQVLSE